MSKKKGGFAKFNMKEKFSTDKMKIEGLKRKKRRMKLKAKGNAESIIENFCLQSCKTAKYAKSFIKKKE